MRCRYNWTPSLISFDADPSHTVRSASYWGIYLLAHFRGTQSLPVTNSEGDFNPLFWAASYDEPSNAVYLKVSTISLPPARFYGAH